MNPQELKDYNTLVDIVNRMQDHFEQLDKYRADKNPQTKKLKLYELRTIENQIRAAINTAADSLPQQNQSPIKNAA